MSNAPIITLEGVGHHYGAEAVLRDIDLRVNPGEILGILGASGCGKSTLLRIIAGFVQPRNGRVLLGETIVSENGMDRVPVEQRGLGMMFQDYALFPYLSVRENVAYGIEQLPDKAQRVTELLELVEMNDFADRRPGSLSGGQQQRVALVRALAPEPKAILLDEPFANLDGFLRSEIGHQVRGILKDRHTPALLVTHDRREALSLSDRIIVLGEHPEGNGATVRQSGTPEEVHRQPVDRDVALLTGPAFFIEGMAQGPFAETAIGNIPLREPQIGAVQVVLRTNEVQFVADPTGTLSIRERRFTGSSIEVLISGLDEPLWAQSEGPDSLVGTRGILNIVRPCATLSV